MTEFVEGDWKNFTFKMAQPEDYPKILKHLEENFYVDEPMNKHMGKTEDRIADMNLLGEKCLRENLSFFAYDRDNNNKIAAVRVTGISRKGAERTDLIPFCKSQISIEIITILAKLRAEADTYEKMGIDQYGSLVYMSVDREYRGRGLANEMYERTFKLLKAREITVVQSVFSSPISQAIASKFGFVELARKYLKDYRKIDGSVFFPDAGEDEIAIVMAKVL